MWLRRVVRQRFKLGCGCKRPHPFTSLPSLLLLSTLSTPPLIMRAPSSLLALLALLALACSDTAAATVTTTTFDTDLEFGYGAAINGKPAQAYRPFYGGSKVLLRYSSTPTGSSSSDWSTVEVATTGASAIALTGVVEVDGKPAVFFPFE